MQEIIDKIMNQKLEVDRISLNPPLKTTGTMTWQERFRQKWEGANATIDGLSTGSKTVAAMILDIQSEREALLREILEEIEKRKIRLRERKDHLPRVYDFLKGKNEALADVQYLIEKKI